MNTTWLVFIYISLDYCGVLNRGLGFELSALNPAKVYYFGDFL